MHPKKDFNSCLFNGDLESAQEFLDKGIYINEKGDCGHFAMGSAINSDNPEVLNFIIRNGANVNLDKGDGWTGLHLAFDNAIDGMIQHDKEEPYQEAVEMITILLKNGADLNMKNTSGETALDLINIYAGNIEGFHFFKNVFRDIVPDIDNRIRFKKNDS